jgi:aspartate aminotransferase
VIRLSRRGEEMPPSPIRKLVPFADAAKADGKTVYHLNIGQPDIKTPKIMMDAFRNHDLEILEYGHSAGLVEYRKKLAGYYQKHDIAVTSNDIIITTGGSEAIIFAMMATMDPGDEIIVPEPFYTNYNGFAREAQVTVVPVTCKPEDGFALPPNTDVEAKITNKTRAIMLCNPGNPTGYIYTKDEMQGIAGLCEKYSLFFMSDEVYREFTYDGRTHNSVMHLPNMTQNAIMLDSVSKRYSACGARIGALVSKNAAVVDAALRLGQARLCPPTMEQLAGMAAIDTPDEYFTEVVEEYSNRRDSVYNALAAMDGVMVKKPGGAFYLVASLPVQDADHFCQWLLTDFSDNDETLMLAPANGFYATPGLGKNEVRIAYVLNIPHLERSMALLKKALKEYKQ